MGMRSVFVTLLAAAFVPAAFATTSFVNCTPSGGTITIGNSVEFANAAGTGSFTCTAGGGLGPLVSVSVAIYTDYSTGDGTTGDSPDNSAGFTFTAATGTWADVLAGSSATTMDLADGVTLFVTGNALSSADTFTNTTSGGLGGTSYTEPATDSMTSPFSTSFTINVSAFLDAGGFADGSSTARIDATFDDGLPEPASVALAGTGLLALVLIARRRSLLANRG
jgi:hypothetical protein